MIPKKKARRTALRAKTPARPAAPEIRLPNVGEVLRRLRLQRKLSVKEVAEACGISNSFLNMVERGASDISLRRLAKLADYFDHDIGTLLGYKARLSKPRFIRPEDRTSIDRGVGVDYNIVRLPGMDFELNIMKFDPNRTFKDAISHEGFDLVLVTKGDIVLSIDDDEYPMHEGDGAFYSAASRHKLSNRTNRVAIVVGITSGHMH